MSGIQLFMEPKTTPLSWEAFLKKAPSRSVALDGYVADGPKYSAQKTITNFNHHENVDRLATRSTCSQILMSIRMNLFDLYRNASGGIEMNIFANDCDEDVCTSIFLLRNGFLSNNVINPKLNKLVFCEDALDASSGAYPFPKDLPLLRELAWIYEPYRRARFNGALDGKEAPMYESIVEDVCHRIMHYVAGNGKEIPLDTRYEILSKGKGWQAVREIGSYARTGMISDGINAYLTVRERKDGKCNYVIGKKSPFVDFDIAAMFEALNEAENAGEDKWGGSDIIGGSPRVGGSSLSPAEVEKIIEKIVQEKTRVD